MDSACQASRYLDKCGCIFANACGCRTRMGVSPC
jgi:hypothetical protein